VPAHEGRQLLGEKFMQDRHSQVHSLFQPPPSHSAQGVKVIRRAANEEDKADAIEGPEEIEDTPGEEKWVRQKSVTSHYMLPVELPLGLDTPQDMDNELDHMDVLSALHSGKVQILQLPPYTFGGDFLAEGEVDEQEMESIEVMIDDAGSQLQ